MAQVVPVITAIGGGSTAVGAVLVASTVAAGALAADSARRAGKFADAQAEINANAEGDAARDREIKRKRMLLRSVSSRLAQAGADGIEFSEGSSLAITQLDIDESRRDTLIDDANTAQRQRGLRAQGRAARASGNVRAATSLLDTASTVAGLSI